MSVIIILLAIILLAITVFLFKKQAQSDKYRSFSILIACRNEEDNIINLINNLSQLDYPRELYEVIIVDDASEDNTWDLLEKHTADSAQISVYHLKNKSLEYKGKKAALKLASESAKYDYLLFTDADCLLPKDILISYKKLLTDDMDAVIGWYQTIKGSAVQRIIDLSSAFVFALSTQVNLPFTASGMNWLVKKKTFFRCGGYENIKHEIAGDDKLLLLQVKNSGGKIGFNFDSSVFTQPASDNDQRLARKYGKLASSPPHIKLAFILATVFYLALPLWSIVNGYELLMIYLIGNYLLGMIVWQRFRLKLQFSDLIMWIIIPYLIIYYTIKGSLLGWKWKGQIEKK